MENLLSLGTVNASLIALTFLGLGLLIGFSHGSEIDSSAEDTLETYPIDLSTVGIHNHERKFVNENVPSVELKGHQDKMMASHFNLELNTDNFSFAPENISENHVANTGHAHVYVDDVLISRSYGEWYHLPRLEPGDHTVRVTLNTNDHREYESEEGVIQDEIVVQVPKN